MTSTENKTDPEASVETPEAPVVRHARREDVPIILELIHALAEYEHASDQVEATESSLLSTLSFAPFSSHSSAAPTDDGEDNAASAGPEASRARGGYARTLLVFTPGPDAKAAGMALYFYNYSTWRAAPGIYVEDLFVKKEHRGRGYGKRLLAEVAKEVTDMRGARLEWSVLTWNEPSIKFYKGIGAKAQDEWMTMRVDGQALVDLAGGGKGVDS